MRHGMHRARPRAGCKRVRRGIVLLEVLLAAAVLAAAALALATLADRCVALDASGAGLLAASRAAENLVAEAAMRRDFRAGSDGGPVDGLPGATYTREVTPAGGPPAAGVYRITVAVSYDAGGKPRKFSLEEWVVKSGAR